MAIVPAADPQRRVHRRRLTLDLFTHHGPFWEEISRLREKWHVASVVRVPPEPNFHTEVVGLLSRYQMPERFHIPFVATYPETVELRRSLALAECSSDEVESTMADMEAMTFRTAVAGFLFDLRDLWTLSLPDDIRYGTNEFGWMTWAPFLSASVKYDPSPLGLLDFADHDDENAADLPQHTFWRRGQEEAERVVQQGMEYQEKHIDRQIAEISRSLSPDAAWYAKPYLRARKDGVMRRTWLDLQYTSRYLREQSYKQSQVVPDPPRRRGSRGLDDLLLVQCAVMREHGLSSADIGRRFKWKVRLDDHKRERCDEAERNTLRGNAILSSRGVTAA